jgi:hypothetical protein
MNIPSTTPFFLISEEIPVKGKDEKNEWNKNNMNKLNHTHPLLLSSRREGWRPKGDACLPVGRG